MVYGCGPKLAKLLLIVFNILFWLSGWLLIVVAAIYMGNDTLKYVDDLIGFSINKNILVAFLVIGIIIFVIGFCGCWSAINENRMYLNIHIVLVLIIIILEVSFGIYAIVNQQDIQSIVITKLSKSIKVLYAYDTTVMVTVDEIQQFLECCGVESYNDWITSNWYNSRTDKTLIVPFSCCSNQNIRCWSNKRSNKDSILFKEGCVPKLQAYMQTYFPTVIGVALGIALFQIFVVICAIFLRQSIIT